MSRVRYAKSAGDLERSAEVDADASQCAMRSIRCVYETDAEVAQAVVPRPLEASVRSEVCVSFVAVEIPGSADQRTEILSVRIGVRVDYDDKPGNYLLTVPMTSEHAVVLGRERFGEPRKLAKIQLGGDGDEVFATVERMGIRYLSVRATRVEELAPREMTEHGYCFKAFPNCLPDERFDQDPRLVRLEWRSDFQRVWRLDGELEIQDSPFDPVADLPVRSIVEFEYAEGTTSSSGRVLRPVPGEWLWPFSHQRYDDPAVEGREV